MRRVKITVVSVLAIILFFSVTAFAGEVLDRIIKRGELVVGISADQPPLHFKTKDGKIIGFDADLSQIMADAMSVKLKIVNMPFHELLPSLEAGKIDMILSGMTITPERNLKVVFVGPYFITGKAFLAKHKKMSSVNNASDLNQPEIKLAVLKDSTSQRFAETLMPKAKRVRTKSLDESLDLLLQDRVDAIISDYPFCVVSAIRYKNKGLVAAKTPFNYEPMGVALSDNDPLLVNFVENLLNTLKGSGVLKKLAKKWLEDTSWMEKLPNTKEVTMLFQE
jgi:polar amino acid transport system substrate-binding protein